MTQLCLTTYNFPSFTHAAGMTHFLDSKYSSCYTIDNATDGVKE